MQIILPTIILSCVYALLGAGFIITYKSSRIINFAFAEIALFFCYIVVFLTFFLGGKTTIPIMIVLALGFFFGLMIYRFLIRPMIGESVLSTIILTVALGIIINAVSALIWKGEVQTIKFAWRNLYNFPGGINISSTEIITIIATIVLFAALGCFYRFSKIGRQMRAAAENILLSSQRRINIYLITGVAWGISVFIIGGAGILFGANYGVSIYMANVALKGLSVALVGGLDSLRGAVPAAVIIALSEKLTAYYINPRLSEAIPFIIMLIVLIVRPWGLFGTEEEIERV